VRGHIADTGVSMAQHLSDRIVKGLPRPGAGNRVYYDDLVSGFGCRVTAAGARAFVLNYRRRGDGVERRYTIGSYPEWTVAGARAEAKTLRRSIDSGGDPVGDLRAQRNAPTVNELCDRFVAEYLPRKRLSTQKTYDQQISSEIRPALGRLKVANVTFADIDRIHRAITKRERKYLANRVVALLSSMFAMAIKWRMRTDNPCKGVERNDEAKRKRYLTGAEMERLSAALSVADQDSADIFRLLLLTGARTGEVLSARWADIDLEAGTWAKPGASTKQRTEHVVPLNAPARQLLAERPRNHSEYVFPGRREGYRVGIKRAWERICKAAQITGLRVHDLRHSYASILASSGVGLHAIGALLGHTQPQTTHRYAHLFDDHLRQATERVGEVVMSGNKPKGRSIRRTNR
jgi:integrase